MGQTEGDPIPEVVVSVVTLAAAVHERVDARRAIDEAQTYLGLNLAELATALDVDRRTLLRYRTDTSTPSKSVRARIQSLRNFMSLLDDTFPTREAARDWLYSPVPSLRSRRPIDLIRSGKLDEVDNELAGLDGGVFT